MLLSSQPVAAYSCLFIGNIIQLSAIMQALSSQNTQSLYEFSIDEVGQANIQFNDHQTAGKVHLMIEPGLGS